MTKFLNTPLLATIVSLSLFASACSQANSAENAPSTEIVTALADSGNWEIQAEGSHLRFSALQEGERFTGEFEAFSGVINFDPERPEAGSVRIEIPLKSVEAGSNDRNSTLPDKVWFSTKAHPVAIFTSTDMARAEDQYVAKGELTLKGITLPLELPFALQIDGENAVMTSNLEIDRTRWNVGAAPWDTDEWVSKAVTLDIQVTAKNTE